VVRPGKTAQVAGDAGFIVDLGQKRGVRDQPPGQVVRADAMPIDFAKVLPPEMASMASDDGRRR